MGILGKFFKKGQKCSAVEKRNVDQSKGTEWITCMVCHQRTPVSISTPAFGTALVCQHCASSLVHTPKLEEGGPVAVSPERLRSAYGYSGCCLIHPWCPWCDRINYGVVVPAKGRLLAWYAVAEPENPEAFSVQTRCVHCHRDYYIEWDQSPL